MPELGNHACEFVGEERLRNFIGLRTWREAGVKVAINTDHMFGLDPDRAVNPFNPFLTMATAVTRKTEGGRVIAGDQGVSRDEALRMMTADGAAALGLANAGVLAPGAWADLVAIHVAHAAEPAEAVLAASPSDVRRTWVAGRVVWDGSDWPGAAATQRRDAADRAGAAARAALS